MGVFFGLIGGSMGGSDTVLKIAVVDQDQSEISEAFVQALENKPQLNIVRPTRDDALAGVRKGTLLGAVIVPDGFGESAGIMWAEQPSIQLGLDPSRQAESGMLQGYLMEAAGQLMAKRFENPRSLMPSTEEFKQNVAEDEQLTPLMRGLLTRMWDDLDQFMISMEEVQGQEADEQGESNNPMTGFQLVQIESIDLNREYEKGSQGDLVRKIRSRWDISFPSAMLWGVLGCVAGFAISIVREKSRGTFLRLKVSPLSSRGHLAGQSRGVLSGRHGRRCRADRIGGRPGNAAAELSPCSHWQ